MKQYAFGIDIGGTTIKMGLFETAGTLLDMWEIPTRKEDGGEKILPDICKSLKLKLAAKGIAKEEVEGIGMGVPGPVGDDGTVFNCVNLGWGVFNVKEKMEELSGLPVQAGNDANVAAFGEMWQGGGKGHNSIVMVTLGTGVGGGVIVGGRIVNGANGAGGEIGHFPVMDDEEEVCGCGKKGCLEQYASATGIVRMTKRYLASHEEESVLRSKESITAKDVFDAAKAEDQAALAIVDQFGKILGRALAYISCVVNPETFVIGGGVSKAGAILMDVVQKYYKEYAFHACRDTEFKEALLSNSAGIYGAVKMVLS